MDRHIYLAVQQQSFDLVDENAQAHSLQGGIRVDVSLGSDRDDLKFTIGIYLTKPADNMIRLI
jgi:hypothetical protein